MFKRVLGARNTTPSCVMRKFGLEPLQFNWFRAAVRMYTSFTQCNSYTMRKNLQAEMQLSSRSVNCWSSHINSAMDGLAHSQSVRLTNLIRSSITVSPLTSAALSWTSGEALPMLGTRF